MAVRKWIFKDENSDPLLTKKLADSLGCGSLIAKVLQSIKMKDADEAKKFLFDSESENDPYLLPDMALAVNRLKIAVDGGEKVAVFGDYDADGITATAIMTTALKEFGLDTVKYIPDRFNDGYGMNKSAIDALAEKNVKLIVTVDCGIACAEEIKYAKTLGIDTIVTDHHNCPEKLPDCTAVINPKRSDSAYPFPELAGAGVAYKIASVLNCENKKRFAELAAIGTVADVVSLTGENRTIVKSGLETINSDPNFGLEALMLSSAKSNKVTSENIAFIIAPRINSAGRMDTPELAYELLTSRDKSEAYEKAQMLCKLNVKRQNTEKRIYSEAIEYIKEQGLLDDEVIVVGGQGWDSGVIGIVAARITEAAYKPSIVISYDGNGDGKASGRSIDGFNLYDALCDSGNCLEKFGGHAMAAGLSIKRENEAVFRKSVNEYASRIIKEEDRIRKIIIDAKAEPEDITVKNITELELLEPTGADNRTPVFAFINAKIADMRLLSEGKHLKLTLEKDGFGLDAIKFNVGSVAKKLYIGMKVHAAGNLAVNDYNGRPQLIIKDILY